MGSDTTQLVAWATLIGGVIGAAVTALVTVLTVYYGKGTDARVRIIKAESDARAKENNEELVQKDILIDNLNERVTKLEAEILAMRKQRHDERNDWYVEQLKCQSEAAELRGQFKILTHQFDQLFAQMYPASQHPLPPPAATAAAAPLQLGVPVTINPVQ